MEDLSFEVPITSNICFVIDQLRLLCTTGPTHFVVSCIIIEPTVHKHIVEPICPCVRID